LHYLTTNATLVLRHASNYRSNPISLHIPLFGTSSNYVRRDLALRYSKVISHNIVSGRQSVYSRHPNSLQLLVDSNIQVLKLSGTKNSNYNMSSSGPRNFL